MSVIAWDGKTLAADKRACMGSLIGTTTKIHRVGELYLCAFAGDAGQGREMLAWFSRGADPTTFPASQRDKDDWAGFVVVTNGMAGYDRYERNPYPIHYEDSKFAFGCGRDFALAAMHCGKSAKEAALVACVFDSACGNGIDTLEF